MPRRLGARRDTPRRTHSATRQAAYRALQETTGREVRLLLPLMALRVLPALLAGRRPEASGRRTPLFEGLVKFGFAPLAEEPGREIVLGVAGRFWRPVDNRPVAGIDDREGFAAFDRPGYAKAAMSFLARAEGRGTRLVTETRIATTDPVSGRKMRRYWRLIRPGSGAIRRGWLAAVRRLLTAEH